MSTKKKILRVCALFFCFPFIVAGFVYGWIKGGFLTGVETAASFASQIEEK
jgi:hypothetical protein